jgi:hypothetical protein
MQIRQRICFFLKKRHPPPHCRFAWKLEGMLTKLAVRVFGSSTPLGEIFVNFWKFEPSSRKSTKFVFEFCGLDPTGRLAPVDTATLSCFNRDFLRFFARAPCPFFTTMLSRKMFRQFTVTKNLEATPYAFTLSKSSCRLFSVEIPSWMGFSRPQLTAVPGLFGWESLNGWDFLGHNLLLSQASFGGNPLMDGIF